LQDTLKALEICALDVPGAVTEDSLKGLLLHSLDTLDKVHKAYSSMFLDVASVLRGWRESDALAVWRGWHTRAGVGDMLRKLQQSSLLEVDEEGRLAMHDVLVALGRSRLKEDKQLCGSRLWLEEGAIAGYPEVRLLLRLAGSAQYTYSSCCSHTTGTTHCNTKPSTHLAGCQCQTHHAQCKHMLHSTCTTATRCHIWISDCAEHLVVYTFCFVVLVPYLYVYAYVSI
jgi:hypothetical protein